MAITGLTGLNGATSPGDAAMAGLTGLRGEVGLMRAAEAPMVVYAGLTGFIGVRVYVILCAGFPGVIAREDIVGVVSWPSEDPVGAAFMTGVDSTVCVCVCVCVYGGGGGGCYSFIHEQH